MQNEKAIIGQDHINYLLVGEEFHVEVSGFLHKMPSGPAIIYRL